MPNGFQSSACKTSSRSQQLKACSFRFLDLMDWETFKAWAQVVEVARTAPGRSIHLAATYGCDVDMKIVENDMAGQVRTAVENIRRSLAAVGALASDVVRVKTYVTDLEPFELDGVAEFVSVRAGQPPVSTAVQVAALGLPHALVEMEIYAGLD
jgi:enamine deaminase RidA (YjgF/YER057c/UK114 family)